MTAKPRSRQISTQVVTSVLVLVLAGCGASSATNPPGTHATAAPTTTSAPTPTPTAAPTQTPLSATPSPTSPASPSLTPIVWADPVTNDDGTVWIQRPGTLVAPIAGDDAMWAVHHQRPGGTSIVRIDPESSMIKTVVQGLLRLPNPIHGMAVNGSIWISSWDRGSVRQFDAQTGELVNELSVGTHVIEPVYAFGDIWTLNHHSNSVSRIDVETGEVAATITLDPPSRPLWMAATEDTVWVVGVTTSLYAISPETNSLALVYDIGQECLVHVAAVGERLLLRSCENPARFWDPRTGGLAEAADSRICCGPGLEVDGNLWLTRGADGDWVDGLVAVDPATGEIVDEFDLPDRFAEATTSAAFDSIWIGASNGVLRVPAETLRQ